MGHSTERHDTHSYETHAAKWLGFRQPVTPGRHGEAGHGVRRHPRHQPRRGVGGERVLVRAVVADRPGRLARHPPLLRVAVPAGREGHRRRVLPLGLREPGARPAGEGRGAGTHAAGLHAQVRRRRDRQGRLPPGRAAAHRGGAGRRGRRRARRAAQADDRRVDTAARRRGRLGRRTARRRLGRRRLAHAEPQARALLRHDGVLRLARARHARPTSSRTCHGARSTPRRARWCWCRPSGCPR